MLLVLSGAARAEEGEKLRLSGFGTLGYGQDDRRDMAPVRDIKQRPRDGFKTGGGWQTDSRLGLQAEYRISASAEVVVQGVLRDQVNEDLNNSVDLAYLGLKPLPQLDVRLGRVGYEAFLMADHRNVGFAYPWVRPATEIYGWITVYSVDGIDATYHADAEDAQWRFRVQAGNTRFTVPLGNTDSDLNLVTNNLWTLSASRESGFWRTKMAYSEGTVGSEPAPLVSLRSGLDQFAGVATSLGLPQIGSEASALVRQLAFKGARLSYATLGATYDDGLWFAQSELSHSTSTATVLPSGDMAYLSLGRRFGDWAPFVRLSTIRPGTGKAAARNDWNVIGQGNFQQQAINAVNVSRMEQSTLSLGARWDFYKQAALKLQWDATWVKPSGYGLWWRDPNINDRKSRINMISATLDFVF